MKKMLLISSLVLVIVTSMVSGTLALYNTSIPNFASGSVVAREFVLFGTEDSESFKEDLKIAPNESVPMIFTVGNKNAAGITSGVNMTIDFTVKMSATAGKTAIAPLTVAIHEGTADGTLVSATETNVAGVKTLTYSFPCIAEQETTKTYAVVVTWPAGTYDNGDYDLAGSTHGSTLTVSASAKQEI